MSTFMNHNPNNSFEVNSISVFALVSVLLFYFIFLLLLVNLI